MKSILIFCAVFLGMAFSFAQSSTKVAITFTYKGNPMCFWDVTIKQGDVEIGRAKTDKNGKADFGYCRLAYSGVDAYGYKKTANGDKKWDVKGYIGIPESGETKFDFLPLVEETGMGGMMETAWGLTLNDCAGNSGISSSPNNNSSSSDNSKPTEKPAEKSYVDQHMEAAKEKQEKEKAEREAARAEQDGFQNSKAMYENKIGNLDVKIKKKKIEQAKFKADSKEYSELGYQIRDLELDKSLVELKLEKTNKEIAKGNMPLNKSEKFPLEQREDAFKAERDSLKKAEDSGAFYGKNPNEKASDVKSKTNNEDPKSQPAKETENKEKSVAEKQTASEETKTEAKEVEKVEEKVEEKEEKELKFYTAEELTKLSIMNLKKLKLDYNSKITNRKVGLKTKSAIWKPEKIEQVKKELVELDKQIVLFEAELAKRKESAE